MKQIFLSLLSVLLISFTVQAQDIAPKKALKKASRALASFNLDPTNNFSKLDQAKNFVEMVVSSEDFKESHAGWQKRGEVYNAYCSDDLTKNSLAALKNEKYEMMHQAASLTAFESFKKSLSYAVKSYEKKAALKGMQETVSYLSGYGNGAIGAPKYDYASGYAYLDAMLDIRDLLLANGKKDIFEEPKALNDHKFVVAYCANAAQKYDRAKVLFSELLDSGNLNAEGYAAYYEVLNATEDANAFEVLKKGKELYPENSKILFAEINKYIKDENYAELEKSIQAAIDKNPTNEQLYSVQGNAYMNLQTTELNAGNVESSEAYYQKSIASFNKAIEIKPEYYDAIYSLGSVYFNKAVEIGKKMNELGTSRAEQKQYEVLDKDMNALFQQALPYFVKAESINADDRNTLIALKEIYARMKDYEKSNEFKKRLEALK